MENIKVLNAEKKHKDFIIYANDIINNVNSTEKENNLTKNIDKDLYGNTPLFKCLIAEINDKPVGMILYSYMYWANDGQVIWISQMFVEEKYRKNGVFFKLIKQLKEDNREIHIMSCATGNENTRMQKIFKGFGVEEIDLKFYYKKI